MNIPTPTPSSAPRRGTYTGLIATDMDGTLLDGNHQIPDDFWPLLDRLHAQGWAFAPASGRQLYTLLDQFDRVTGNQISVIAENGTVVYHEGEIVSTTTLAPKDAHAVIETIENTDLDWGVVLCRADGAFVSRTDNAFLKEGIKYYHRLERVEDLHEHVNDQVIKLAVFSFPDAETVAAPLLRGVAPDLSLVISGAHWIDLMAPEANKGVGLRLLAQALDIPMERTIAFGDFLNDLELLQAAGTAVAMENAHPKIKEVATRIAPPNTEHGVLTVLEELLN